VLKNKPQVKDFVNYYLTNVKTTIAEVGYFAQPDKVIEESNKSFLSAIK
jgi:ABC-type phosphate transport system substrate-binding protein